MEKKKYKYVIFLLLVFIGISFFTQEANATVRMYGRTALTGGTNSVDNIPFAALNDNDLCIVITNTSLLYHYRFEASSTAAESLPDVIMPQSEPETGRWLLVDPTDTFPSSGVSIVATSEVTASPTAAHMQTGRIYSTSLTGTVQWYKLHDMSGTTFYAYEIIAISGVSLVIGSEGCDIPFIWSAGTDEKSGNTITFVGPGAIKIIEFKSGATTQRYVRNSNPPEIGTLLGGVTIEPSN